MEGHRKLLAWQRSMDFAASVYGYAKLLREQRLADVASQLQRAAVSIPANIAEGKGRGSPREFARFLRISLGSLREVETLLHLALKVGAPQPETATLLQRQADEVGRLLYGLERAIKSLPEGRRPTLKTDG